MAAPSSQAQDTPKEARFAAQQALAQGDFKGAIAPLAQLIQFLGTSDTAPILNELEHVFYNLGLCHFLIGDFDACRTTFTEYLVRYPRRARSAEVMVLIGDAHRFQNRKADAIAQYQEALRRYQYDDDWQADIHRSIAKCHLADEQWELAMPILQRVYQIAPDADRRVWAASLMTIGFLKKMEVEKVYNIMGILLNPDSFAARSAALNLSALEAGDLLFAEERYRDALWIYRIVYSKRTLQENAQRYLVALQRRAERLRKSPGMLRQLIRVQESVAEVEQEIAALASIRDYDQDLSYRVARSYLEIRRYNESFDLFYTLYRRGESDRAEECLFLAFSSAIHLFPWDKAFASGHEYLEKFEGGAWYDRISLIVGQLHARQEEWPSVIGVLGKALEVHPKHEDVVECMHLLGYASFMEELFGDAADWMIRMNREYPGNQRQADGEYWAGMAKLFDKRYDEAMPFFDRVVSNHGESVFAEDAQFRSATCDFGLSRWEEAERKLLAFLRRWPESKLGGEAYVMLGDLSGFFGRGREAVQRYQKVPDFPINIELYNYSQFRCGEVLADLMDHEGVVRHFTAYLERKLEGINPSLAIFNIGNAHWQMDQKQKALDVYFEAIESLGQDRMELGIDLIVEEWIGKSRGVEPEIALKAWERLRQRLRTAMERKELALAMRLARALVFAPDTTAATRDTLMGFILRPQNIPIASAGMLDMIGTEAWKAGNRELALLAAREMVRVFPETDSGLSARVMLADDAIARNDLPEAILHLTVVREVYASAPEAGEALLKLGALYLQSGEPEQAAKAYSDVLGVREWRPLWPAALYGRGEVAVARKQYAEATAYFERIYVMYSGDRTWTAKAYLARARALQLLREYRKAQETLEELVRLDELKDEPAASEGRKLLLRMKGGDA